MYVSDCCGASPKGNGDCDSKDFGICPECGEHCEYIDEEEEPVTLVTVFDGLRDIYSPKKSS